MMEMLNSIKILIGIENDVSDVILTIMIKDAEAAVIQYCNRKNFPIQLSYIVRECVIAAFKKDNEGDVSSIKRGDTQINYFSSITTDSFTPKQLIALNRYRKITIR